MIRYRWPGKADLIHEASQYRIPGSERLQGRGPWVWQHAGEFTTATLGRLGDVAQWSEWRQGLGGCEYALADPLPQFCAEDWQTSAGTSVRLTIGAYVVIRPLTLEGHEITLTGAIGMPLTAYGQLAQSVLDRIEAGEQMTVSDPLLILCCREAIRQCQSLTDELIHAWSLLSTDDLMPIMEAIAAPPKRGPGAGQ